MKDFKLIPSSRRFWKDKWHPYGWEVGFRQTVEINGKRERHSFRDVGMDRGAAIGNALRYLDRLLW